MTDTHNRPLAAADLTSYRYRAPLGFIMIGARDEEEALREAARSTSSKILRELLQVWDGSSYVYLEAEKPSEEDTGGIAPADFLKFALAGRARFTLVSAKTEKRYTYRISTKPDADVFFASVLTGPDNGADFHYIGFFKAAEGGQTPETYAAGAVSRVLIAGRKGNAAHPAFIALDWALSNAATGGDLSQLEIFHEGRCGRCSRALTVPESVRSGFGPECAGKVGGAGRP